MWRAVRDSFDTPISLEPLPEHCRESSTAEELVPPIEIEVGDSFGDVVNRLEIASGHRWRFEEIRGTPVLRPNVEILGQGNALDTRIDLNVENASVWDSLCALAQAINRPNAADGEIGTHLRIHITRPGPGGVEAE